MKTPVSLCAALLLCLGGSAAPAATPFGKTITLAWDNTATATDGVTGFNFYERAPAGGVDNGYRLVATIPMPATTYTLAAGALAPGPHVYSVTAISATGESGHSNEVTVAGLPSAPTNLRVTVQISTVPPTAQQQPPTPVQTP